MKATRWSWPENGIFGVSTPRDARFLIKNYPRIVGVETTAWAVEGARGRRGRSVEEAAISSLELEDLKDERLGTRVNARKSPSFLYVSDQDNPWISAIEAKSPSEVSSFLRVKWDSLVIIAFPVDERRFFFFFFVIPFFFSKVRRKMIGDFLGYVMFSFFSFLFFNRIFQITSISVWIVSNSENSKCLWLATSLMKVKTSIVLRLFKSAVILLESFFYFYII